MLTPNYINDRDLPKATRPLNAHNYRDFVSWFMARYMPGFPMGLIESDTGFDYDEWELVDDVEVIEVDLDDHFTVDVETLDKGYDGEREAMVADLLCIDLDDIEDGEEFAWFVSFQFEGHVLGVYIADPDEAAKTIADWIAGLNIPDSPVAMALATDGWEDKWFVETPTVYIGIADGDPVIVTEDEDEARDEAYTRVQESRHAFPWAHSWCFRPEDNIQDEDLKAAGFRIGTFRGYRLAGIDGYGYNFPDSHFLRLAWAKARDWGLAIPCDDGTEIIPL